MTDIEPGGTPADPVPPPPHPPPPPQAPGTLPPGYVPAGWVGAGLPVPPPPVHASPADAAVGAPAGDPAPGSDRPFLDTPWVPPRTRHEAWVWLAYAVAGFLVGQIGALVFGLVAGAAAGKTSAQMQAIASEPVPPEWYVVSTLLGLWIGFVGAPWLASRTQGTRRFARDLGLRFRPIDVVGIAIGLGGQIVVALMYAPFQRHIHDFNAPSQRLTGGAHGGGFVVIALATVLVAPFMEELFFRGLLLKGLVRVCSPEQAAGRARAAGVVVAVIADGLLFGLAHGEWVQLAGLATFGAVLAAVSYRTGRLGMNMVAHASFNFWAILAIAVSGTGLVH